MKVYKNLGNKRIVILIFLLLLVANFYLLKILNDYIDERARLRFEYHTEQIQASLQNRINAYEEVLLSGRGLYNASESITRQEWKAYIESLGISQKFPGIQGIGFLPKITAETKDQYINSIRAEGFNDYAINPPGERDIYFPITYIEPFSDQNLRAFGYDMYSDLTRKEAMDRARDTNSTAISSKVTLIQDAGNNNQPGFLIYAPVYAKGTKIDTVEERTQNLVGYVYAPFRINDLMKGVLGSQDTAGINFEIYEDENLNVNSLMYDTNGVNHFEYGKYTPQFVDVRPLLVAGRTWYIYYDTLPVFTSETSLNQKYVFPITGLLISLLIPGILYLFANSREQAISIAKNMVAKLHESEEQYKTVVQTLQEGILLQDATGKVITFNKRAEEILGLSKENLEGRTMPEYEWYAIREDGSLLAPEEQPFAKVQKTHKPQLNITVGIHKGNNEFTWIRANVAPIFSTDGKTLTQIVTSIRDITEQKVAEDDLRNSNLQLQRSNSELQDFAYVASHDLQEPLRKITSFSNLLVKNYKDILPDQGQQFITIIQNSSKRMSKLINDLLNYSRVTTKAQPFEKLDLKEIVEETLSDIQIIIEESKAKIKIKELCSIEGDELQLNLLFQNLIINAIKYAKADTQPVIEISSEIRDTECIIYVKDNGIGFDEKYLEKIFTIFQRLHGKNEYEGTGIGLAICKKIVERHNGIISARSKVGEGSTFIVTLPLKQNGSKLLI
jgi:PAS domain S-box-containing protein